MFKIGEFSKLSQVSIRMLRHYDKIDLLVPKRQINLQDIDIIQHHNLL